MYNPRRGCSVRPGPRLLPSSRSIEPEACPANKIDGWLFTCVSLPRGTGDRLPVLLLCLYVNCSKNSFFLPPTPIFWPKADAKLRQRIFPCKYFDNFFWWNLKIFWIFYKTHLHLPLKTTISHQKTPLLGNLRRRKWTKRSSRCGRVINLRN